jgi:hypothetical protein
MNRVFLKTIQIFLVFTFGLAAGWYIRGAFTEIERRTTHVFEENRLEEPIRIAVYKNNAAAIKKFELIAVDCFLEPVMSRSVNPYENIIKIPGINRYYK